MLVNLAPFPLVPCSIARDPQSRRRPKLTYALVLSGAFPGVCARRQRQAQAHEEHDAKMRSTVQVSGNMTQMSGGIPDPVQVFSLRFHMNDE